MFVMGYISTVKYFSDPESLAWQMPPFSLVYILVFMAKTKMRSSSNIIRY